MSKGEIIDFVVLRIQSELEKYQRTKTIPHLILDGAYSIDEIKDIYYEKLTPRHQKIANKLLKEYNTYIEQSIESIKVALRKEYQKVMSSLATEHRSFYFESVMKHYRLRMNPVKGLYYQAREMLRRFNVEDPQHLWLYDLLKDKEYKNILLDALAKDIKRLERIIKRYHQPLVKFDDGIPLELFHAKQQIKDFRHFYTFFDGSNNWNIDE
tara:strand:+ start:135 stop:767 length:633 start_codon:yes stop_codon:yes gene_type:complete